MLIELTALVLRTVTISELDKIITLYSAERGIVTAGAKGAMVHKNRAIAACQPFCYAKFILYRRGDKCWVREAEIIEGFYDIRLDITKLALASYFCEVLGEAGTNQPDPQLLRLALNSLYAISKDTFDHDLIKAAFEMRFAALLGWMPDLEGCHVCGRSEDPSFVLDLSNGVLTCKECRLAVGENNWVYPDHEDMPLRIEILNPGALAALRYTLYAPLHKLFSFRVSGEDKHIFCRVCETYLLYQMERTFQSLIFYRSMKE